jgi:hypothetical protein
MKGARTNFFDHLEHHGFIALAHIELEELPEMGE